jgi:hypothetical protein
MSMLFQRHGNLYKSKVALCVHEEIQEGLEIKSIDTPTPNHCSFYRQKGHALTNYPFIENLQ